MRCSFYFLSFPKGNRSLSLFSLSPFWTETNNRPFPLHFSWCWMSKGGSQRSRNILLEWYFESSSPPLSFFPSRDGILGCCNNSVCLCVRERKQLTQSKDNSKLQLNDRLGAPVFWIALFSFYSCLGGGLKRKKKKAQLGQKASSLVSGELLSAQTKIAGFFADKHFLMWGCFFVKLGSFCFLIYDKATISGKKGWVYCCLHLL